MTETPDLSKLKDDELMRLFWAATDSEADAILAEMHRRGFAPYGGLRDDK